MQRIISTRFKFLLSQPRFRFSELERFQHSFLTTTNVAYIESLYEQWTQDKASVSPSFAAYFELLEKGADPQQAYESPDIALHSGIGSSDMREITKQLKMRLMIDSYRSIGHQFAKVDPLYLPQNKNLYGRLPEESIQPEAFGFEKGEMQDSIVVKNLRGRGPESDNGPYTIQEF